MFTFHRPEELARLVKLESQVRENVRALPAVTDEHLWQVQMEAIQNLEKSLAANRPRVLIQMATGSGKTYTACSFCYRLIKFGKAKRILFLVDRNNLGRHLHGERSRPRRGGRKPDPPGGSNVSRPAAGRRGRPAKARA